MTKRIVIYLYVLVILCPSVSFAQEGHYIIVKVAQGQNLIRICGAYLEEPRKCPEVSSLNRLKDPDLIFPGETIVIPVSLLKGVPLDGVVTFVKGDVTTSPGQGEPWRPLQPDDSVAQGSGIRTGTESAVEIAFEDGTSLFLSGSTELELRASNMKGGLQTVREIVQRIGRIITRLKKAMGQDSRFEIQTPSAVAGAKGTEFRVSVDERETTRSEVIAGVVGVEGMGKTVDVSQGEGTFVRKNEPPASPKQLLDPPLPLDLKPLYRTLPLEINFSRVRDAVAFRIFVARDRDIKDVIRERVVEPLQPFQVSGVEDGIYFLESRSIDADGLEGLPHGPVEVAVRTNPLPPFIQAPAAGARLRDKAVSITWLRVPDAGAYHIQVAEDDAFTRIVEDSTDISGESYTAGPLDFRKYFYKISSIAADGYEGVWSDPQPFTIIPPPPAPPMESPDTGEQDMHLRWRDLGEGTTYRLQMARDSGFTDIVREELLKVPELVIPVPEASGTYYVRTSGIDKEGYEGDFSLPQSFEIKQKPRYEYLGIIGAMAVIFLLAP